MNIATHIQRPVHHVQHLGVVVILNLLVYADHASRKQYKPLKTKSDMEVSASVGLSLVESSANRWSRVHPYHASAVKGWTNC